MATLPYIQLYVSDYLSDTQHLTAEEHGAYLLIIMNYWQTEKPIPQNRLQGISRVFNDRWTNVKQVLSEFFTEDENGCWYHTRIEQDLDKVKAKSKQASDAGKKSAEKRASKKPINKEDSKVCLTTVQHNFNERSTIEEKREKRKDKIVIDKKGSRIENLSQQQKDELQVFMHEYAIQEEINKIEISKFIDYWKSATGIKAIKVDWKATFRNWCRTDFVTKQNYSNTKKRIV